MSIVCLIVEPVAVVAEDLSILVRENRPDARCLIANSEAEAATMLRDAGPVDVTFLNLRPGRAADSALAAALAASGTRIVILGDSKEARAMRLDCLPFPYTAEGVGEVLAGPADMCATG